MERLESRTFNIHVVRIISASTLIINVGADYNEEFYKNNMDELAIKVGDKVKIFVPGPMIIDPVSNEELGHLDIVKDILEIVELLPQMAICKKIKRDTTVLDREKSSFLSNLSRRTAEVVPLDVLEEEIDPLEIKTGPIKIGDIVQLL